MSVSLRPYQTDAVERVRDAYRAGHRRPLLVLPTGGGKTVIFAHIARQHVERGGRVLILVHRRELLRQAVTALSTLGVSVSIAAPGHPSRPSSVLVASVQTLARRDLGEWAPSLVVVDEGHHATAGTWGRVLSRWPGAYVLGVTATPCRTDGAGLGDVYDALVCGPSVSTLTAAGYLAPAHVYCPPQVVSLAGVGRRGGDYATDRLVAELDRPSVTGDAVGHYRRILAGAPAIAFCASVAHAASVAASFRAAGYAAEPVDGTLDDDTRADRIAALGDGRLNVLTSCEIVSEGTDIPVVTGAILLRPTLSQGLYLQQVGRVLRPAPAKSHAVILDHVGNVLRHGMPDDDREWALTTGRPEATRTGPPPPVVCIGCYGAIRRPCPPTCPHCGHEVTREQREPPRQTTGELAKVDREAVAKAREAAARARRAEERECRTLEDFRRLGRQRGHKPGWAEIRYSLRAQRH